MATPQLEQDWRDKQWTKAQQELFNRVLLAVLLIGLGVWIGSLLFAGDNGYAVNIYTEILSIGVTVGLLNYLAERRSLREYKEQLVRNAGSRAHDTALSAIDEMRKRGWLINDEEQLLKGATLSKANLSGANLSEVDLSGASLYEIDLSNADLSQANLSGVDLGVANLSGASLFGANLNNARLLGTDLSSAILVSVDLSDAMLGDTEFNEETMLPDGIYWSPELTTFDLSERFGVIFDDFSIADE
ncbi:MAG: hypothetical protein CL610_16520 [Anaerolineaceae bacterium]|nr:hypothetical protein [Anaerolineaceae bacterium]